MPQCHRGSSHFHLRPGTSAIRARVGGGRASRGGDRGRVRGPGEGAAERGGRPGARRGRVLSPDAHRDAPGDAGHRPRARAQSCRAAGGVWPVCPLNAPMLGEHGVSAIIGGEFEDALVASASAAAPDPTGPSTAGAAARSSRACISSCPIAPGCRRSRHTRRSSGAANAGRPATPRPAAAASIGAATVRSCPCTTGDSASSRSTSSWPTFARRSRRARSTSRSAIRTSSTASGTPRRSSNGSPREFPGVSYDVTIKVEHLLEHADALPRLRDTGCAFVTTAVESVDDRVLGASREGTHARRLRARRRERPRGRAHARADVRRLHAVDDARGLLRSAADDRSTGSRRSRVAGAARDPPARDGELASAGVARRARGDRRVQPALVDLSLGARGSPRRRSAEADRGVRRRQSVCAAAASSSAASGRSRTRRPASPCRGRSTRDPRRGADSVHERALVLLRRADVGAGGRSDSWLAQST